LEKYNFSEVIECKITAQMPSEVFLYFLA